MADQHDAGAHPGQFPLQPLDAGQVQMIGRLVEQQDVGRGSQRAGQRRAACFAAGQGRRVFVARKAEFLEQIQRAVATVRRRGVKPRLDISQGGAEAGQIGFLRQVLDRRAGLGEALAGIGLHQPGGDAQQCRFAGTVAPDQADPVAGGDGQPRAGKQRRHTEGQADVLQQKQWWRHGWLWLRVFSTVRQRDRLRNRRCGIRQFSRDERSRAYSTISVGANAGASLRQCWRWRRRPRAETLPLTGFP